ncbi:hypothetical protein, partial [Citrobacter portucalensis]|uniref:hypothetical protein n=1 Tax=Citrobacter portucalensis TaxID=1639133 RepID=UPI00226B440E
ILAFQNHTDGPLTDLRGKASIFSHPVTSLSGSLVSRINGAVQAELKAFAEKAATRAKQKAIEMMIAIFPNWKPSD